MGAAVYDSRIRPAGINGTGERERGEREGDRILNQTGCDINLEQP